MRDKGVREMSVRRRLTVWYSLALGAGLAFFAAATWLLMWHSLSSDIDTALQRQAASVEKFLKTEIAEHSENLNEELEEYAQGLPAGTRIQLRNNRGELVFASNGSPGRSSRQLARSISVNGSLWQLTVSESLDSIEELLGRLRVLLVTLIPLILMLAAAGGLWLSARALRPVDAITAAARSIGIANLSERLRVPQTGDELQRLAETWNGMLARLEDAVKRLSRFTADASHELRTPLAVIRTTAEIAARHPRSEAQYREALAQIIEETERMTRLVEDLLFLARCDSETVEMPMSNIPLKQIVQDVCAELSPLAESKNVYLGRRMPEETAFVMGNEPAVRRLVLVLLDNAIKYSNPGGEVRISLHHRGDQVHLEIQDAGPGIAESELPRIFERFYRTPQAREIAQTGTGLGLSLAAGIAQQHRARIEVQSTPGLGSTFRVLFQPA